MDAIAQVVRGFADDNITHVEGHLDPLRDISIINMVSYYKKRGDYKRAKMFKLGLVEYEYTDLISEDDQEKN